MAASSKIPIYLFQVLEDEYAALHGEELAHLDWSFRPDHIKNAAGLISRLDLTTITQTPPSKTNQTTPKKSKPARPLRKATADPDELAKNALISYLRDELKRKKFSSSASGAELVAEALNTFLTDPNLFAEERFSNYWLNSATRGMRDVHTSLTVGPGALGFSGGPLTGDDLEHFNRLLLEDAFPHFLQKIHRLRLDDIYKRIHQKKQTALCFSGGGIRSGTFALGLLQGLARHNLLDKFHILSTVSGGGYIGSWLAAWIHRHPLGIAGVTADLANTTPRTKVDPDPEPIRFLRRYSSFITPKVGLLTADTWTFIAIYLRNLLLNWLVFIPLLLSVLTLPRFIVSITNTSRDPEPWPIRSSLVNLDLYGRHFFLAVGFILVVWAIAYIMFNRPTLKEELRQSSPFWRRKTTQGWFLSLCLLPLSVAGFCLTTYWSWSSQNGRLPKEVSRFLVFGVITTFLSWLIGSYILGRTRPRHLVRHWKELFSRDLLLLLVAGAAGGALLFWLTQNFDPFKVPELWKCEVFGPWQAWKTELYACFAAPAFLLVFLLGATLYIGVTSKSTGVDDEDREWWARLGAWILIVILGWILFTSLVILGPIALLSAPQWLAPLGGLSGVLAALAGNSAKTSGAHKASNGEGGGGILSAIMGKALPLLAVVFIAFLLSLLSLVTVGISQFLANNLPVVVRPFLTSPPFDFDQYLSCIYSNVPGNFYEQTKIAHMNVIHMTSFRLVLSLGVLLFLVGSGISLLINLNIFSLHAGYRNRIIRAFLGASRPERQRKPNPFTGFDPADNVNMHELRPGLFDEDDFPRALALASVLLNKANPATYKTDRPRAAEVAQYLSDRGLLKNLQSIPDPNTYSIRLVTALRKDLNGALGDSELGKRFPDLAQTQSNSVKTADDISSNRAILEKAFGDWLKPQSAHEDYRLMPVINTTLNLVGGDNLAWQQRKAEPFSVSPLHAGCFRLGYRDSRFYGGRDTGGISIGTAAAISGAAASSNMGYYTTSPVLSLVLTFFNVRLGWWLGNPGTAGNDTFGLRAPTSSVKPILDEALGMTNDENKYVYLTDGGHFENLGIYEMVLRRCHLIIISDAAADPDYNFSDLGNAVRKVRIDLGVPIEFTAMPIFKEPRDYKKGMYWAIGRIRYSCIDGAVQDGLLVYLKPVVYGIEPGDVLEYKKNHPTFPHQSTADQFFDEPQFESYRILGSHVMDQMCGSDNDPLDLDQVITRVFEKLTDESDGGPADSKLKDWFAEWLKSARPS
jgi:hypothetical protein